jgi:hypothetical protein
LIDWTAGILPAKEKNMTIEECEKLVIVEWCEEDGCFHIDSLAESLLKNIGFYLRRERIRYAPVAIVESDDAAIEFVEGLEAERGRISFLPYEGGEYAFH